MKRKRILSAARRVLAVNAETVIETELLKLRAPFWLRIIGIFDYDRLRDWYKAKEQETEERVKSAARGVYRRAKK